MANPFFLLRCVAKAVANAFGGGIAGDLLFEAVPEVASDVWKWWHQNHDVQHRQHDVAALAAATPAQIKQELPAIIQEVAGDRPIVEQQQLAIYLSLIPGQIRKSLRRPEDPGGTTVGIDLVPAKSDDLIAFLPGKLPRFKPGDHPLPSVDWELDELLGVGGFGEVWKARNPLLSSVPPVALKFCLDSTAGQFLRNEAAVLDRVMRQGRHPGIVTLQHTYLSAETPCLEYEYVAGGDLASMIQHWHRSSHRPTPHEICEVFHTLTEIIAYAHSQTPPIVHRDLKPANILVQIGADGSQQLKVADFGIGGVATRQAIAQNTRGTSRGMFLCSALRGSCTPLYAGPQQMRGELPDPRDDVYSLGVIGYQMLTGDLLTGRPGGTRWQKRLVQNGVDEAIVEILGECFEDNLEDRIADAGQLAQKLKSALEAKPVTPAVVRVDPVKPPVVVQTPAPVAPVRQQETRGTSRAAQIREEQARRKREQWLADLKELTAHLSNNPEDAEALARRGEVQRQLGEHLQAIADCTEAIRLDSGSSQAYSTRGSAYRMRGQLDLAIADCSESLRLDAENVIALFNRGEVYRLKRELDKAIADFTRAIELDPGYSWAFGSRGATRQQKGDLTGAIEDLNESIRLEPGYAWAWVVRGETHRLLREFERAIADCNEAIRLQPDNFMACATRGAAFRQKGDYATAIADLGQALRLKPDYQWARDQLDLARRRHR